MVRVLSIPLFKKENVNCIERSVATCCVALPHKFLVASSTTHSIEVNHVYNDENPSAEPDLSFDEDCSVNEQSPTFSFPTVDSVRQMIHCLQGNYIATIEVKSNTRQNRTTSYVRVYANWDNVATLQQSKMNRSGASLGQSECGMVQPMRARIAGRVTPSVTQANGLEMIEIPVKRTPTLIACCQISGHLLIGSERRLSIYQCVIKTHDSSKQTFLDFEAIPQFFELNFVPTKIQLNENYISAFNLHTFFVFKVVPSKLLNRKNPVENKTAPEKNIFEYSDDFCIQFDKLCENKSSLVNMPMVVKENVLMYKNLPFMNCRDINVIIKSSSPIESTSQSYEIHNILQLKIRSDINVEGVIHPISEEFSCFASRPIYVNQKNSKLLYQNFRSKNEQKPGEQYDTNAFLESQFYKNLQTIVYMVATSQEGYLFHINTSDQTKLNGNNFEFENKNLVGVYSFTTPILDIGLQDTIVHALTYSGLESYTLKPPNSVCSQNDPIYLINLNSFLGVKQLLLTEKNLILLANYDGSPVRSSNSSSSSNSANWTIYNLELPSVLDFNKILLKVGEAHRADSIQTYLHLLNKSYILLHLNLLLLKFELNCDSAVPVIAQSNQNDIHQNFDEILKEFHSSCMLLADHYILSQNRYEYKQSIFYYKLANLTPADILRRFMDLDKPTSDFKELQGLLYYLNSVMLNVSFGKEADDMFTPLPDSSQYVQKIINSFKTSSSSGSPIDLDENEKNDSYNSKLSEELYGPQSLLPESLSELESTKTHIILDEVNFSTDSCFGQTFADLVLDIFNVFHPTQIAQFVIQNTVIREYATNKIINILIQRNKRNAADNLALTLLYLQKNETTKAQLTLAECSDEFLQEMLWKHPNLLFDSTLGVEKQPRSRKNIVFSELTTLLISNRSELLSDIFFKILTAAKKTVSLREIIQIFVEYLPSHVGDSSANATNVFHLTLEKYLLDYFGKFGDLTSSLIDHIIRESLKLLCRCYMSKLLVTTNMCQTKDSCPAALDVTHYELEDDYLFKQYRYKYLQKMPIFDMFCEAERSADNMKKQSIHDILIKLEAMLCSNILPISAVQEIDIFLRTHQHFVGKLRLQSIILPLEEAVQILVERYPMALQLFAQERFTEEKDWQMLILALEKQIALMKQSGVRGKQKLRLTQLARKEVLIYLATTYSPESFVLMLPSDEREKLCDFNETHNENSNYDNECDLELEDDDSDDLKYSSYIELCKHSGHANKIQQCIIATGQQLLTTLNL